MKKTIILGVFCAGILLLLLLYRLRPRYGGLYVSTNIPSAVVINNKEAGTSSIENPIKIKYEEGEIILKIIPKDFKDLSSYESRVQITSGVETVVRHQFGTSKETSISEVLTFEKIPTGNSEISIVSIPANATVFLNGLEKGLTPMQVTNIDPGMYTIELRQPGYTTGTFDAKVYEGYKLMALIHLPKSNFRKESVLENDKDTGSLLLKLVEILPTEIGYLQVRSDATLRANEVGRVIPGRLYTYIDQNTDGWIKIIYEDEKAGWIPNKSARIVNN